MVLQFLAWIFKTKGWKLGDSIPKEVKKCVVIAAPHTSNWDFVYAMGALHLMGLRVRYFAKKELFKWPLKWVLESTGAIAIDRSKKVGMVEAAITQFNHASELILMIAGEGTRGKVTKWKSGFYHVAVGAKVPLMLAYLDYARKEAGFSAPVYLTGDREKDAKVIRNFYTGIVAKYPENFSLESIHF